MGLPVPKPKPIILLTRPLPQSEQFAEELRNNGFAGDLVISPLLDITGTAADIDLTGYGGVVFSSRNAIDFAPAGNMPAFCVGDKTAEKARSAGWEAVSANGDADDLVKTVIRANTAGKLLHLRGEHSRGDIAKRLSQAGIETDERVVYQQNERPLSEQAIGALSGKNPVILPLFSPRTARLFTKLGPFQAPLHAVAMSEAVAQEMQNLDLRQLVVAAKPTAASMLSGSLSLIDAA